MPIPLCCLISHIGDWTIRVDSPHGRDPQSKKHVQVSKRRIKGEYAWNIDGSRHDSFRFPASEQCIKAAKDHAASALGVPISTLKLIVGIPGGMRISVRSVGEGLSPLAFTLSESYVR